jgi:hypothetical protein
MHLLPIVNRARGKMSTGEDLRPALNGRDPSYHRYHAEPFAEQEGSCWEKHQMEEELRGPLRAPLRGNSKPLKDRVVPV